MSTHLITHPSTQPVVVIGVQKRIIQVPCSIIPKYLVGVCVVSFSETLRTLRLKSGKSRYRLAHYTGLSETYLMRLEKGERANPSRDVVLMLGLALVERSDCVEIWDIDSLLLSAGYAPLRKRGEVDVTVPA